jgi:hypothetical protein
MTDADLMKAIRDDKVVMAGSADHWIVIIGFCTDTNQIEFIEAFDPADGTISLEPWVASKYSDFYAVG